MSRLLDGIDDQLVYALPGSGIDVNGAHTLLIVAKFLSDSGWASLIETERSTGDISATIGRSPNFGNTLYWSSASGITSAAAPTLDSSGGWMLLAATKTAGANAPRMHVIVLGGTADHRDAANSFGNPDSIASGTLRIGGNDDPANIKVAAAALFGVALADTDLDAIAAALTTQSIADLSPAWLVDDSDGLATNLVNPGSGDRSTLVGTADDPDDPAGWVYGLGGGGVEVFGTASLALTLTRTTAAKKKAHGASALALTATRTTTARRIAHAAASLAANATFATAATKRSLGAVALPLALSVATVATKFARGASSLPLAASIMTAATKTARSAVALPLVATITTTAKRGAKGAASLPLTLTITTRGLAGAVFGAASLALSLTVSTVGRKRARGAAALSLTLTTATAAVKRAYGRLALPVQFSLVTRGKQKARAAVSLALSFVIATIGRIAPTGTGATRWRFGLPAMRWDYDDPDSRWDTGLPATRWRFGNPER